MMQNDTLALALTLDGFVQTFLNVHYIYIVHHVSFVCDSILGLASYLLLASTCKYAGSCGACGGGLVSPYLARARV